ncbi:MAG: prepilin-type N-terminal cleavage/methylation domain-containing protein [Candidatus Omnitrophica bacterium]|nr:prepilin-type N-terminal cleavage/methylation domain-containing protein [Candidatus Omnitrophota bacterium]MDD5352715.1 prepilin-type N-terminal cleavage/methylation domain-containing protein [Candidatus Omnitrophota bacterium]MDD5550314.1 prepilin-type N-terminal cleavage/methylation domain-containing protein [Candidatus Omnitrophota bacterium]
MRKSTLKSQKAFTLVEIMIVVGIIILLAALAIPNLLRARMTANEATAIKGLKTLQTVFVAYRAVNPRYPQNFAELCDTNPPYLDESWWNDKDAEGVEYSNFRSGYRFMIKGAEADTFFLIAEPETYGVTGGRTFYMSENGEMIDAENGRVVGAAPQ